MKTKIIFEAYATEALDRFKERIPGAFTNPRSKDFLWPINRGIIVIPVLYIDPKKDKKKVKVTIEWIDRKIKNG